jgi:hypothetical protein
MALQTLDYLRAQQSSALAHFDTFFIFAVVAVAAHRSCFLHQTLCRGKKDARVAAE